MWKWITIFGLLGSAAWGNSSATVQITKGDGRKCQGAFIAPTVVATAAHCLDNFRDGGVTWEGRRSQEVFVADAVARRGRATNDDDFALLVFGGSHSFASPEFNRRRVGESVTVVTYRNGYPQSYGETISSYTSNQNQTADVFVATGNSSGLSQGDSGSPLFSSGGQFLGALRGCVPEMCGFFSVHSGNPVAREVFQKIRGRYPHLFAAKPASGPGPSPVTPAPRPQSRKYTCSAQCKIEYQRPYAVATETVRAILISATSAGEAAGNGRSELDRNCNEYCLYSRDAYRCTLASSIQCD